MYHKSLILIFFSNSETQGVSAQFARAITTLRGASDESTLRANTPRVRPRGDDAWARRVGKPRGHAALARRVLAPSVIATIGRVRKQRDEANTPRS